MVPTRTAYPSPPRCGWAPTLLHDACQVAMAQHSAGPAPDVDFDKFQPRGWLRNPHAQTLLANKPLHRPPAPPIYDERLELPDGDVVRLVRSRGAASASPRVVVLHGLAGAYESAYARELFEKAWLGELSTPRHCWGTSVQSNYQE